MCLTSKYSLFKRGVRRQLKIAKKDMIVYKRFTCVGTSLVSPYQGFTYERNKEYGPEKLELSIHKTGSVWGFLPGWNVTIREGFHSYVSKENALSRREPNETVLVCVIPKGAEYILGLYGDIVSSVLRVTDQVAKEHVFDDDYFM